MHIQRGGWTVCWSWILSEWQNLLEQWSPTFLHQRPVSWKGYGFGMCILFLFWLCHLYLRSSGIRSWCLGALVLEGLNKETLMKRLPNEEYYDNWLGVEVLRGWQWWGCVTTFRVKETKRGNMTRPSRAQIKGAAVLHENANMPPTLSITDPWPAGASHWQTSMGSQEIREQGCVFHGSSFLVTEQSQEEQRKKRGGEQRITRIEHQTSLRRQAELGVWVIYSGDGEALIRPWSLYIDWDCTEDQVQEEGHVSVEEQSPKMPFTEKKKKIPPCCSSPKDKQLLNYKSGYYV